MSFWVSSLFQDRQPLRRAAFLFQSDGAVINNEGREILGVTA
jgi:hypothetical protein